MWGAAGGSLLTTGVWITPTWVFTGLSFHFCRELSFSTQFTIALPTGRPGGVQGTDGVYRIFLAHHHQGCASIHHRRVDTSYVGFTGLLLLLLLLLLSAVAAAALSLSVQSCPSCTAGRSWLALQ